MTTALNSTANAYLRTQVMSASAEELRLMLIDGAIRFTTLGRDGLAAGNHEQSYSGFTQARAIVSELMTSMRSDVAPELCERVRSLYSFMYAELVSASLDRDAAKADRVLELLRYERETWVMLMDELKRAGGSADASSRPAPNQAGPTSAAQGQPHEGPTGYRPLSIQG